MSTIAIHSLLRHSSDSIKHALWYYLKLPIWYVSSNFNRYLLCLSSGTRRIVEYTADANGFNAVVRKEGQPNANYVAPVAPGYRPSYVAPVAPIRPYAAPIVAPVAPIVPAIPAVTPAYRI